MISRGNIGMAIGEVKWFSRSKGFGFICPDFGPRDIFVHSSALHRAGLASLEAGQRVEFELTQLPDGRTAALGLQLLEEGGAADGLTAPPE